VIYKIIIHTLFPYCIRSRTGLDVRKGMMGNILLGCSDTNNRRSNLNCRKLFIKGQLIMFLNKHIKENICFTVKGKWKMCIYIYI
jgi:hypothetical protein